MFGGRDAAGLAAEKPTAAARQNPKSHLFMRQFLPNLGLEIIPNGVPCRHQFVGFDSVFRVSRLETAGKSSLTSALNSFMRLVHVCSSS